MGERQRQKETERHRKGYVYNNNRKEKKALNLKVSKEGYIVGCKKRERGR